PLRASIPEGVSEKRVGFRRPEFGGEIDGLRCGRARNIKDKIARRKFRSWLANGLSGRRRACERQHCEQPDLHTFNVRDSRLCGCAIPFERPPETVFESELRSVAE